MYYADLYPLISFLPRFSTHVDHATEEDILPLWKASEMDHDTHKTMRSETMSSGMMSRTQTCPTPGGLSDMSEKESQDTQNWYNSVGKRSKHKSFDPEAALPVMPSERPLMPSRNPPTSSFYDYFGFLRIFKPLIRPFSRRLRQAQEDERANPTSARRRTFTGKKIRPEAADSNVPVEIALFLSTYFAWLMRQGLLTPASATAMNNAITVLQDTVVNLERIKNTPLPFAYQAHLRISLW